MQVEVCKVSLSLLWHEMEGTHFVSSVCGYWHCCIWEQVQPPTFSISSHDWSITVILTLRTWAVWDRNQWLSIILPILYSFCWISGLVISVQVVDSTTCKLDFHCLSESWLIYFLEDGAPPYPGFKGCFLTRANPNIVFLWAILLVWDARKFSICYSMPSLHWLKMYSVLLILILVPAIQMCEQLWFWQSVRHVSHSESQIAKGEMAP